MEEKKLPEPGTRIRVVVEGSVQRFDNGPDRPILALLGERGRLTTIPVGDVVSFEVLPDPEPDWARTSGEVVRDREGDLWRCKDNGRWDCVPLHSLANFMFAALREQFGPLTRLVPAEEVKTHG